MSILNLKILFSAVDQVTAPLKNIQNAFTSTTRTIESQQKALQGLTQSQRDISRFEKLKQKTTQTSQALHQAQTKVKALGLEIKTAEKPTKQLTSAFVRAQQASTQLQQQHTEERSKLAELNRVLKTAGVNTSQLSQAKRQLTQEETRLNSVLAEQARREATLQTYHAKKEAWLKRAKSLSIAGGVALGLGYTLKKPLNALMHDVLAIESATQHLKLRGVQNITLLTKSAQDLTAQYAGITPANYLEAAQTLKTGMKNLSDESLARITQILALTSKATGATLSDTAERFSKTFTAFELQTPNLNPEAFSNRYAAAFSYLTHHLKATGADMHQAMDGAGNSATTMGMDFLSQMATLGLLQQTLSASDAGQALRNFGLNAGKAEANFKNLADTTKNPVFVQILNSQGQLRQLPLIFKDLHERYGDTLDALEQEELKTAFGNDDVLKFVHTLYPQMQRWLEVRKELQQATASGLAYTQQLAEGLDAHLGAQWEKTQQRLTLLKISLGRALIPTLEHLLNLMTPIIRSFTNWVETHPKLAKNLGAIAIILGGLALVAAPVLLGLGMMTAGIGLLIGILPKLALAIRGVAAAATFLVANPIGLAITVLATGALLLINYWEPVCDFFRALWATLQRLFEKGQAAIKWVLESSPVASIIQAWMPIFEFFTKFVSGIQSLFKGLKDTISASIDNLQSNASFKKAVQLNPMLLPFSFGKNVVEMSEAKVAQIKPPSPASTNNNVSQPQHNTWHIPITIQASPSMDTLGLAEKVKSELLQIIRPSSVSTNTGLYDPL